MFSASVTVANAASAQTAHGVTVTMSLPPQPAAGLRITGLHATGPRVTGGGAGWSCDVWSLTCTGTLPSGASSRIAIAGRLPADSRPGDFYTVRARASVAETSQRPGTTRTTTSLTVAVHAAVPGAPGSTAPAGRSPLPLTAVIAAALLLGGGILLVVTRRTRPPARHSLPRLTHIRSRPPQDTRPSSSISSADSSQKFDRTNHDSARAPQRALAPEQGQARAPTGRRRQLSWVAW